MSTTVTITQLLRNPKKIRELTEKGLVVVVLFNNKPVFEIRAFQPKKPISSKKLPSFKLDIGDNLPKQEIYEKYGA